MLDNSTCANSTTVIQPSASSLQTAVDQSSTQSPSMYDAMSGPVPVPTNHPVKPAGNRNICVDYMHIVFGY